jgi:hypothetical protein
MYKIYLAALLAGAVGSACTNTEAMTPDKLQQQYGIAGAYAATLPTPEGPMKGTVVPVTLADGRTAQLILPAKQANQPHTLYVKDAEGLHPVQLQDNVTRQQMAEAPAPAVVGRRAEPAHAKNKDGWEKDALIIGGGAGGGAVVGALAGGKKGAGIGAAAGGIGALIYDLAK